MLHLGNSVYIKKHAILKSFYNKAFKELARYQARVFIISYCETMKDATAQLAEPFGRYPFGVPSRARGRMVFFSENAMKVIQDYIGGGIFLGYILKYT